MKLKDLTRGGIDGKSPMNNITESRQWVIYG